MYGFAGKYLVADLSTKSYEIFDLPENYAKDFLGGPSLGARLLWDLMPKDTPCFDEKSVVGFVSGTFNNTPVFFGGRYTVVSKSPFYNGFNDANGGGFFGDAIRKAGFDAIFIKGISKEPVYLYVKNRKVEFRNASGLWGRTMPEADKVLKTECNNPELSYAMIGIAGENMALEAAVMNDLHRAAARGGTAAIMGSKKLKAVVCEGNYEVEVFNKEALVEVNKKVKAKFIEMGASSSGFAKLGTSAATIPNMLCSEGQARNFSSSMVGAGHNIEQYSEFDGMDVLKKDVKKDWGCGSCPLRCGAILSHEEGKWPIKEFARPEYESWILFGVNCLNDNKEALYMCNELCNLYGMDTIGAGGTIAWAIQAYNDGALSPELVDNIDLTYGNAEGLVELTRRMVTGEGCGKVLMHGSKYASDNWNCGKEFLVLAGNMEISAHDSRRQPGYARTYFSDPTPARHVKGGISSSVYEAQRNQEERFDCKLTGFFDVLGIRDLDMVNSTGLCRFGWMKTMTVDIMLELVECVTGFKYNKQDSFFFALRSFTARHMFGYREGYTRDKFTISPVLCGIPALKDGPIADYPSVDVQRLTDNLYNILGYKWDGMPLKDSLELMGGMQYAVDYLYPKQ